MQEAELRQCPEFEAFAFGMHERLIASLSARLLASRSLFLYVEKKGLRWWFPYNHIPNLIFKIL